MTAWKVTYISEARNELLDFDKSQRIQIQKAISKVSQNPLPYTEGGYGKPLSNTNNSKLAGCLKIKLRRIGVRVVYRLQRSEYGMEIIVIGIRSDDEVYAIAMERLKNMLQ